MTAVTAAPAASLRMFMRCSPPPDDDWTSSTSTLSKRCFRRVGYIVRQTPFMPVADFTGDATPRWRVAGAASGARQVKRGVGSAEPGRRIGQQGIEGHLGRADERRVDAERRRDDADERARAPAGRTASSSASMRVRGRAGSSRACGPPRMTSRGLRMFTRPASPMPSQRPTCVEGGERRLVDRPRPRAGRRRCRRDPRRPGDPAQREQHALADLGLPAADRAAAARRRRPG